ncbi:hypothetical protein MLD38_028921 [Melastoma candidum]|uniref:Uncharacterized protein n=1 Tax=Melastoma candidum TaxID=119954 RepID=A0ACB9N2I7_9MYRT|nr:hypothetical protein MLD38_028921 [Melastoma candidum]
MKLRRGSLSFAGLSKEEKLALLKPSSPSLTLPLPCFSSFFMPSTPFSHLPALPILLNTTEANSITVPKDELIPPSFEFLVQAVILSDFGQTAEEFRGERKGNVQSPCSIRQSMSLSTTMWHWPGINGSL